MPESAVTSREREQDAPADHLGSCATDQSLVRGIGVDLGVNTHWQEAQPEAVEQALVIPPYEGAAEIGKMALMFTLWAGVESYLYEDCETPVLNSPGVEKKHLAILNESETMIICLLCLLSNDPYTAGGLVDAMLGPDASADQKGNARKRLINRTLPVIAGRYELLQFREHNKGNLREYSICRSVRLARFAEQTLVTGVQQITGVEQ